MQGAWQLFFSFDTSKYPRKSSTIWVVWISADPSLRGSAPRSLELWAAILLLFECFASAPPKAVFVSRFAIWRRVFEFANAFRLWLWWFAVVRAAGLDALAVFWSGVPCGEGNTWWLPSQWFGRCRGTVLASYNCFLWIPKVTGSIFETFCFPLVLGLCPWWFAVVQAAGLDAFLPSGLDAFLASYNCFLWIPKVTGSNFETFCFPLVLGLCLWWFAVVQAAGLDAFLAGGLDAFLASYNCFLWIPKVTGSIFETFCFPLVLGLCLWWFAVVQAAGLDAFLPSGLDAFLASYNCFLWIPKVTGSIFETFCFHLFSTRFGPVSMVVCRSAGGWFGRFPGRWFGRFPGQLQLIFYGFQRWREAFLKRSVFHSFWACVYGGLP